MSINPNHNLSNNNESTSVFMSVQSENVSNANHLLLKDARTLEMYEKFGCYLTISTNEPTVDVRS
jgi:hypothetical protein